jgi:5-oxoprolinase (ATP-hydrolysing)/N-methylhydantoinase A
MYVAFDIGGTFTDVVTVFDDGRIGVHKILSLLDRVGTDISTVLPEPEWPVDAFIHATTIASNAVIEGTTAPTALITTTGFRDEIELRYEKRPGKFDLNWERLPPLVPRKWRLEVDERIRGTGDVQVPLNREGAARQIDDLLADGPDAIAICLINSYANDVHEREVEALVRSLNSQVVVCRSTDVHPEIREHERASTTVINTSLVPVVRGYLTRLRDQLAGHGNRLFVMQSNGGVMEADTAQRWPVRMIESGPAAGALAAACIANASNLKRVLAFDMGGTTAKACLIEDGLPLERPGGEIGAAQTSASRLADGGVRGEGYAVRVPSLDIVEVGAGGGSIAWVDSGGALRVGPMSAGAEPGPVCYGRGGTRPTVTDANLVMGYLNPETIAGSTVVLDRPAAEAAIARDLAEPLGLSILEAAYGVLTVANATMMRALRSVSTERGRDPREHTLVAFGGAGPLHAAPLAELMGIRSIHIPICPGVFSAVGLLLAPFRRDYLHSVAEMLEPGVARQLVDAFVHLEEDARKDAENETGTRADDLTFERRIELRYPQQSELSLPFPQALHGDALVAALRRRFEAAHQLEYQFVRDDPIQIMNLRLRAVEGTGRIALEDVAAGNRRTGPGSKGRRRAYFGTRHGLMDARLTSRADLSEPSEGPVIIDEPDTTIVVPPGWSVRTDAVGSVVLEAHAEHRSVETPTTTDTTGSDPILLEVIRHELAAVSEEVGIAISRTGRSQMVKIGDFATALFDADARLIGQGRAAPFQLGIFIEVMRNFVEKWSGKVGPGDVFITNDPYAGMGHLPDIAVITPSFWQNRIVGYVLAYSHQTDIGGRFAGGMSSQCESIYEEGLRLPYLRLIHEGGLDHSVTDIIAANVRGFDAWTADVEAKIAGCHRGGRELARLLDRYGFAPYAACCEHLVDEAERSARRAIAAIPDGHYRYVGSYEDDGFGNAVELPIAVDLHVQGDELTVDFTGTAPQAQSAINLPVGMTIGMARGALRALIPAEVFLNAGFVKPIRVHAPEGSLVNPRPPAAVGGRSPVAFRVADVIFRALGEALPQQVGIGGEGGDIIHFSGTTNAGKPFMGVDIVFGGWGGRPTRDGIDGVTMISFGPTGTTPVELLERDFPIAVERFGFLPDTAGPGTFRGSVSICREWRFLEPTHVMLRTNRLSACEGMAGGLPGALSRNVLNPGRQNEQELPRHSHIHLDLAAGDVLRHCVAGSGGYGNPLERDPEMVRADVESGLLSSDVARHEYAVVIDPVTGAVDRETTRALRQARPDP